MLYKIDKYNESILFEVILLKIISVQDLTEVGGVGKVSAEKMREVLDADVL